MAVLQVLMWVLQAMWAVYKPGEIGFTLIVGAVTLLLFQLYMRVQEIRGKSYNKSRISSISEIVAGILAVGYFLYIVNIRVTPFFN